jgi:hypothetical protein
MRDAAKVTMQNSKELASQLLKLSVFCNQPLLEKGTG